MDLRGPRLNFNRTITVVPTVGLLTRFDTGFSFSIRHRAFAIK